MPFLEAKMCLCAVSLARSLCDDDVDERNKRKNNHEIFIAVIENKRALLNVGC